MTTDSPPSPESEPPSVPDEVWDRFLTDSERDIRATAPKEPSARARIVARRLREEDAREAAQARARFDRRTSRAPRDTAWRSGRTDAGERARARRERIRTAMALLVAVLLALVLLSPHHAWSLVTGTGRRASPGSAPTTLPPETARPSTAAPVPRRRTATILRPFAGSPAEAWGDGAAAIVPPPARAYGAASAAQVAAALARAKAFLTAADLDPHVLRGARPSAALALIDPANGGRGGLVHALAHPVPDDDPVAVFTRFAPEAVPVANVVKVRGGMTTRKGRYGGVAIDADYTFVYAVRSASDTRAWPYVTRTVVRRTLTLELPDPARYAHTPGTLLLTAFRVETANAGCGPYGGFLHPEFPADAVPSPTGSASPGAGQASPGPTPTPSGRALDPYDRSRPIQTATAGTSQCRPTTRI